MEYVKESMDLDNRLKQDLFTLKESVVGTVHIGIPMQMQVPLVHQFLPPFLEKNPNVDIVIEDDTSPTLEKAILNSRLDCALIYIQSGTFDQITYDMLKHERIFVVCSKGHRILNGHATSPDAPLAVTLEDIKNEMFFLMDTGFIVRSISDEFFKKHFFRPRKKVAMSSMNALMNMVCSSAGIAFIPEYEIKTYVGADNLAYLEIEREQFCMDLALIYLSDKEQSPAASIFINFVNDFFHRGHAVPTLEF